MARTQVSVASQASDVGERLSAEARELADFAMAEAERVASLAQDEARSLAGDLGRVVSQVSDALPVGRRRGRVARARDQVRRRPRTFLLGAVAAAAVAVVVGRSVRGARRAPERSASAWGSRPAHAATTGPPSLDDVEAGLADPLDPEASAGDFV